MAQFRAIKANNEVEVMEYAKGEALLIAIDDKGLIPVIKSISERDVKKQEKADRNKERLGTGAGFIVIALIFMGIAEVVNFGWLDGIAGGVMAIAMYFILFSLIARPIWAMILKRSSPLKSYKWIDANGRFVLYNYRDDYAFDPKGDTVATKDYSNYREMAADRNKFTQRVHNERYNKRYNKHASSKPTQQSTAGNANMNKNVANEPDYSEMTSWERFKQSFAEPYDYRESGFDDEPWNDYDFTDSWREQEEEEERIWKEKEEYYDGLVQDYYDQMKQYEYECECERVRMEEETYYDEINNNDDYY